MNLYLRSRHNRKRVEVHCIATDGYNAGLLRPNHRAAPQLAATIVCLSLLIASGADDTDEERAQCTAAIARGRSLDVEAA